MYVVVYGGSSFVLAANCTSVVLAQVSKFDGDTTVPELYMAPCQIPHSSLHRTMKVPSCCGVVKATLFWPGLASAFTPNWYAQKSWTTSSDVTLKATVVPSGITSWLVSKPPKEG